METGRSDPFKMDRNSSRTYSILFTVRLDRPFPYYPIELDQEVGENGQLRNSDANWRTNWSRKREMETVLKKVGDAIRHRELTEIKKNERGGETKSPKSIRRRAAVFDHHDVHPDWKETAEDAGKRGVRNRQCQDITEQTRSTAVKGQYGQDKMDGDNSDQTDQTFVMSQVNQMRTERLANALKSLETKRPDNECDAVGRTQSMKHASIRRRRVVEATNSAAETLRKPEPSTDPDGSCDSTEREFRRRTSSAPQWEDPARKHRPNSGLSVTHGRETLAEACDPGKLQETTGSSNQLDPSSGQHTEEYERMRTFTIDPANGAVVNRGDSFRRRCSTVGPGHSPVGIGSRASSALSSRSHSPVLLSNYLSPEPSSSPTCQSCPGMVVRQYHIVVLGLEGVGKSCMINQFTTSEHCNLFQNESNTETGTMGISVTVVLNGEESQLTFIEADNRKNDLSLTLSGAGYMIVYSVDDPTSFENAKQVLFQLRLQTHSADKPIILVGNKVDLERKRVITTEEGKAAAKENDCKFVEIAVALGHHVDELLVGILAQVRHNGKDRQTVTESQRVMKSNEDLVFENGPVIDHRVRSSGPSSRSSSDSTPGRFQRSSSKRAKGTRHRPAIGDGKPEAISCSNLTAAGHRLADRVFGRRRGSRSVEDLLAISK